MKIKNRSLKKTLCSQLLDCKSRSSNVIGLLRQIQDLSKLPNEIIAKLNDSAFKAI